jgi:hypothetical protein
LNINKPIPKLAKFMIKLLKKAWDNLSCFFLIPYKRRDSINTAQISSSIMAVFTGIPAATIGLLPYPNITKDNTQYSGMDIIVAIVKMIRSKSQILFIASSKRM